MYRYLSSRTICKRRYGRERFITRFRRALFIRKSRDDKTVIAFELLTVFQLITRNRRRGFCEDFPKLYGKRLITRSTRYALPTAIIPALTRAVLSPVTAARVRSSASIPGEVKNSINGFGSGSKITVGGFRQKPITKRNRAGDGWSFMNSRTGRVSRRPFGHDKWPEIN